MPDLLTPLKVVFLGSPEFAVPSLRALYEDARFEVALVVTQPDRRAGRGKTLHPPAVKVAADNLGLRLSQPASLNDEQTFDEIAAIDADLFVVVAYGEKLERRLLEAPRFGCLNVHPSLLPRYRGSSPIAAAILNGDAMTGVSIIRLTRRLDAGPIVSQTTVELHGNEQSGELSRDLSRIAASVLPDVAAGWCRGTIIPMRQDHAEATYTIELTKVDGRVDWRESAERIERQVRAMTPWPGCWTILGGRRLALARVAIQQEKHDDMIAGTILAPESYAAPAADTFPGIVTGGGIIRLVRVTPEGKREMSGADWWRGSRLEKGARAEPIGTSEERSR